MTERTISEALERWLAVPASAPSREVTAELRTRIAEHAGLRARLERCERELEGANENFKLAWQQALNEQEAHYAANARADAAERERDLAEAREQLRSVQGQLECAIDRSAEGGWMARALDAERELAACRRERDEARENFKAAWGTALSEQEKHYAALKRAAESERLLRAIVEHSKAVLHMASCACSLCQGLGAAFAAARKHIAPEIDR